MERTEKKDYETKEMAWDLRQIYARLVGVHLVDCADARNEGKFYEWFKALENIKTITKHKFVDKENTLKEYEKLIKAIKEVANKYSSTWNKKTHNTKEIQLIDKSLRDLEEYLYEQMQEGGIFGTGNVYDEDEI